jgi:hypothetical protein
MPLNVQMESLIVTKADLLMSDRMPDCLLDLVAHVASYRGVIALWDEGHFSEHKAPINFPREAVTSYAARCFEQLKREQQDELIGNKRRDVATSPTVSPSTSSATDTTSLPKLPAR